MVEALEDRTVPALLGLAQQGTPPDLTSGIVNNLSYTQLNNNANPFHYDSIPLWITMPDTSVNYINDPSDGSSATTNLDLNLTNAGTYTGSGGSFSVTGSVALGAQNYDGTLLTAQPTAFGFANAFSPQSGEFEVQLTITGGQLTAGPNNPYTIGNTLGLLIHQPDLTITTFPSTFSFSSMNLGLFDGISDAVNIPMQQMNQQVPPPVVPQPRPGCNCGSTNAPGTLVQAAAGNSGNLPSEQSPSGVRYGDGVVQVATADLSSAGYGVPWGQTRSWTNGPGYASQSSNGNGVVDTQLPSLIQVSPTTLAEVSNGTTAYYYDLVGGAYQPRYFDESTLTFDPTTNQYDLTDELGDVLVFSGFVGVASGQQGQLSSYTDPGGDVTSVTGRNADGQTTRVQRSAMSGGNTVTESYVYDYVSSGVNAGLLQDVTLERQINNGPETVVRQVVYTYYDGSQPYGNAGDLMTAVTEDASGNPIDTSYYRYYTAADAGSIGYVHGLKYSYDTESFARLETAVGDPFTATDAQVAPYASTYFQYDSQQRVTEAVIQGDGCSSCSGGLGTYTYTYTASGNPAGFNSWNTETTETLPDGNQNYVYTNAYGEVMLSVYHDTTTNQSWPTFYQYDGQGRVTEMANPSAVTGYDDSYPDLLNNQGGNYQYLSNDSGLITRYDYYTGNTATETDPGGVTGYQFDSQLQQGQQGTLIPQTTYQYYTHTANGSTVHPEATSTGYRYDNGTGAETTTYIYTYYPGTTQVQSMTTSLPTISAAQNGPGAADVSTTVYDAEGRAIWNRDGDGYLSYAAYDTGTGAVIETIADVNTANPSDFSNLPAGWSTPPGGGLNLVTTYQVDSLGRVIEQTTPNGNVTYTVYDDPDHESRIYPGWNAATGMPTGPTQVYRVDLANSYTEMLTMSAAPHLTGGVPDGTEPITDVQTLERNYTNAAGQDVREDSYFNLSGLTYSTTPYLGAQNTNYYTTQYSYDHRGRLERTEDPNGTITRDVYDGLGRLVSTWEGTDDTPGSGFWSPTNNTSPSNMVEISAYVYDGGGVGDSNLTQETDYPGGGAAPRVTQYYFDWRDRQVAEKDGVLSNPANEYDGTNRPIYYSTYDNLGEVTTYSQYDGDGVTIQTTDGVPQPPAADLLRVYNTTGYDDQGRVYQTDTYDVNPMTGTVSSTGLTTNFYYDHRGDQIAESDPGGLWSKDAYDGAGRQVTEYTTDGGSGTTYAGASSVANDVVLEQTQTIYDADNNVIETIDRQRFNNATGTGALGDPTSTTAPRRGTTTRCSITTPPTARLLPPMLVPTAVLPIPGPAHRPPLPTSCWRPRISTTPPVGSRM